MYTDFKDARQDMPLQKRDNNLKEISQVKKREIGRSIKHQAKCECIFINNIID